jgi:hypothetical protein
MENEREMEEGSSVELRERETEMEVKMAARGGFCGSFESSRAGGPWRGRAEIKRQPEKWEEWTISDVEEGERKNNYNL